MEHLILADAQPPVAWFAYPGERSSLVPDGCEVHELSPPSSDVLNSLEALVEALNAGGANPALQAGLVPPRPDGPLTAEKVCQAIGAILPEGAILSDEAITSAAALAANTAGAPRHDWLTLTGGAIGQGLPVAVGAAIACPDRPVIALEADGSALYTIQSLWTMARERLDITVVIFNNRAYGILAAELARLGGDSGGDKARALIELRDPNLDFVKLGTGFGIASRRVETAEQLTGALDAGHRRSGPASHRGDPPQCLDPATGAGCFRAFQTEPVRRRGDLEVLVVLGWLDGERSASAMPPRACPGAACSGRTRSPPQSARSARVRPSVAATPRRR